jgi:uncharacterized protein
MTTQKLPKTTRYTNIPFPGFRHIPKQKITQLELSKHDHIPKLPELKQEFSSQTWQNCTNYLYAIDLFNYAYYWEVHEVLENLWMKVGKKSPEGLFIQGLIQLSVALLKNLQSNKLGLKRLTDKAMPKLLSQQGIYLGVDIRNLINQFNIYLNGEQENSPIIFLQF